MLFNSIAFLLFLAFVYTCWRTLPFHTGKFAICLASFFFYAYWFPPFILLLLTSGLLDYAVSLKLAPTRNRRRAWLALSITGNLSILFFFKYVNLFQNLFHSMGTFLGIHYSPYYLNLILPMGISFYTFQSMSYTIDVYRKRLEPCKHPIDFFLYLSFFPQLVAGPIVRAIDFLPQLKNRNPLTHEDWQFITYRMCRGYFLKVVIADNIATSVNRIFSQPAESLYSLEAWFGVLFFAIQIFCDFSGYSDIAIGIARLFGFKINENFRNPYLACGLEDFWTRWHISLSRWFRDYLYYPLGGSRAGRIRTQINILAVFLLSGLWHGANWTFIFWGLIHGVILLVEKKLRSIQSLATFASLKPIKAVMIAFTLAIVLIAWVPFRSPDIQYAFSYWKSMFLKDPGFFELANVKQGFFYTTIFFFYYAMAAVKEFRPDRRNTGVYAEALCYFTAILLMPGPQVDFIYFQF